MKELVVEYKAQLGRDSFEGILPNVEFKKDVLGVQEVIVLSEQIKEEYGYDLVQITNIIII